MDGDLREPPSHRIEPRGITSPTSNVQTEPSLLSNVASGRDLNLPDSTVLYPKIVYGATSSDSSEFTGLRIRDPSGGEAILGSSSFRRNERRGRRQVHTKSKTGCYSCKKRRIKCDENRPTCTQCTKRRLHCEWPAVQVHEAMAVVRRESSGPLVPRQPQSQEASFVMQDFRLFYHFTHGAYPHFPIGDDSVWTHEIPSISHNYDYLLHAMLALSASDLTVTQASTPDLVYSAMAHRIVAIKSLNQAMSKGIHGFEEGNAMLATCYMLLFQSVYLEDCLAEFMSFMRGCAVIAKDMGYKRLKLLFSAPLGMNILSKMDSLLIDARDVNPEHVDTACKALDAITPLCQKEYEKSFHKYILKATHALYNSPREAYLRVAEAHEAFTTQMSHAEFQDFTRFSNQTGQVIQSHFVALHFLLYPTAVNGCHGPKPLGPFDKLVRWLGEIHSRMSPEMREYCEWPISVEQAIHDATFYRELSSVREVSESIPDT